MSLIRKAIRLPIEKGFFTAILSGGEGGLATTTAIVVGLFISTEKPELVLTTAVISFMVQAFNSSVSRFSAEHTESEIEHQRKWYSYGKPVRNAVTQFIAHIVMSFIVVLPIIFVVSEIKAIALSILLTLIFLFAIGAYKGRLVQGDSWRDGIEMVVLGSMVISVGVLAGLALTSA